MLLTRETDENSRRARWAFLLSFCFNLGMMLLLYRIFDPVFEGNDDVTIAQFANGACGSFDPHLVYQNILMGHVLVFFYRHFPLVPWYSWLQYGSLCASFTAVTYVLCMRLRRGTGFCLALLVQAFAAYECYITIQYTKTAGILSAAGMFLIWYAVSGTEDSGRRKISLLPLAAGLGLAFLSILYRYAQFAACAVLTGGIPLLILLDRGFLKKTHIKEWGKALVRCAGVCLGLGLMLLVLTGLDRASYAADPAWKNYAEYNEARSELMDYGMNDYDSYEEVYEKLGISRTAYDLFDTWNSADTDVFSKEAMRELAKERTGKALSRESVEDFIKKVPKGFWENRMARCFLAAAVLWILLGRHDRRAITALAFQILLFTALYFYLFMKGRYLYNRVDVGLWMSNLAVLLWLFGEEPSVFPEMGPENSKSFAGTKRAAFGNCKRSLIPALLILAVMTACGLAQIPGWKKQLAGHRQDSIRNRAASREQMMEIASDTDHLYITKLGIMTASNCCGPFEAMPQGMLSNLLPLGGWKVESVPYNAILQKYGFDDNPYEALGRGGKPADRIILADEDIDQTLDYLHEYYDPALEAVPAGDFNGSPLWTIVKDQDM